MTEYWVSQGNKWCEFCKIYISNNPASIRNHELGQRHRDRVADRLSAMRKENAAKEKEQKAAALALQQIEAKASRSYQKDVASVKEASNARTLDLRSDGDEDWEFESTSGYYFNRSNGLHYDPNSGFYYSDSIGKWVTQEEAYANIQGSSESKLKTSNVPLPTIPLLSGKGDKSAIATGPSPGLIPLGSSNQKRSVKGNALSAVAVTKRKRSDEKSKVISPEEKAALKAREAAKKRVEEREKPLLGLYQR